MPLTQAKDEKKKKQAFHFAPGRLSYMGNNTMRVDDVSDQSLQLRPADDLMSQMTGKAVLSVRLD